MKDEKDIFDFLDKKPQETPGKEYFENLAQKIISENKEEKSSKTKVIPLYKKPMLWIAGAAAAAIAVFFLNTESPSLKDGGTLDFNDLSKKEILAYVDDNIDDFDEEMLIEFMRSDQVEIIKYTEDFSASFEKNTTNEPTELTESLEAVSKEDILDYLDEEELELMDLDEDIF